MIEGECGKSSDLFGSAVCLHKAPQDSVILSLDCCVVCNVWNHAEGLPALGRLSLNSKEEIKVKSQRP